MVKHTVKRRELSGALGAFSLRTVARQNHHLLQILCPALDCPLALSIAGACPRSYPAIWNTIQGLLATIPNGKMQIAGAIPWQSCNMVLCHLEALSQRCDGIPNGNLPLVKHQLVLIAVL